jgi:hypothetical protein
MVAAGCELQSRFTGYESEALSPDFRMEAAGGDLSAGSVEWGGAGLDVAIA